MLEDALPPSSLEILARATTQGRCADAYLHEIRGSFQALVGAVELLCRVAKGAPDNADRADKVCELARRAVRQHEKTTLDLFGLLSFRPADAVELDLRALAEELVHLFRNDAATRDLSMQITGESRPMVRAARSALHAAVATLLWVAIDASPAGTDLRVTVEAHDGRAVLSVDPVPRTVNRDRYPGGAAAPAAAPPLLTMSGEMLTVAVRQSLSAMGGGLSVEAVAGSDRRILRMTLPVLDAPNPSRDDRPIPGHDTAGGPGTR